MNAIHTISASLLLLSLGGCASVNQVADTPAAPLPVDTGNSTPVTDSIRYPSATSLPARQTDVTEVIAAQPATFWDQMRDGFQLTGKQHASVRRHADKYGKSPQQVERIFERGQPYLAYILGEVQKRNFPTELVLLPFVESSYDPFAFSYGRAAGMWQFIPATGKIYGLHQDWWYDGRRDVVESTRAALNYLDYLQDKFDGDWLLAIAAYNSGSGAVSKAIKKNRAAGKPTDFWHLQLPKETAAYVPRLLAVSDIVSEPGRYDISLAPVDIEPAFTTVAIPGQLDISVAAELAGVDTQTLYLLNPGFNRWTTHPQGPHEIRIPATSKTDFETRVASLPEAERTRQYRHKVKRGETLSQIAVDYNTTTAALVSINHLDNTRIRSDQYLTVPTGSRDTAQLAALDKRIQAASAASVKQTYRVRPGDNLWVIARKHHVTVRQVSQWNKLNADRPIRPGQKLVIYRNGGGGKSANRVHSMVYTVRSGDSLYRIAKRFNVSINDLVRWNKLSRDKLLHPGQNLKLYVDATQQATQQHG